MGKKNKTINFQLSKNKKIKLRYFGPFLANSRIPPQKIAVDEYFKKLSINEQKSSIWHELYHRKCLTGLKRIWLDIKCLFTKENSRWLEEFSADKYSAENNGKDNCLKLLYKCKDFYDKNIVDYDPDTHPAIEERIKRIKDLKE